MSLCLLPPLVCDPLPQVPVMMPGWGKCANVSTSGRAPTGTHWSRISRVLSNRNGVKWNNLRLRQLLVMKIKVISLYLSDKITMMFVNTIRCWTPIVSFFQVSRPPMSSSDCYLTFIWHSTDIHLNLTWSSDHHLTIPWPLQDPYHT